MKNHLLIINSLFLLLFFSACSSYKKSWEFVSPSGKILFSVDLLDDNQLSYQVFLIDSTGRKLVIGRSELGIRFKDQEFVKNMKFIAADTIVAFSETFTLPLGKRKTINNTGNELTLTFENEKGVKLKLVMRAYNDGVAFRYFFPDNDNKIYTVEEELTSFAIAGKGKTWIQPYDEVTMYSPAYERYYENGIPIGTSAPSEEGWCFPALFQTGNNWILLTEAAVDSSYFAAHLQPSAEDGKYSIRMPEVAEANHIINKPFSKLPWAMPWRVILIGPQLSDIVENNMVEKLNSPSKIADETWIKPGLASWSWWSDWASPKNFGSLKKFVDFSAEMGWEYFLVDANWDLMEGGSIEKLIKYANSKNVGILMWYNSAGEHNKITERPRDIMSDPVKRKEEFKKLAELDVKGVKVDFFQSDKPMIIKKYFDILEDAANNKILVNFHGCTFPKGWNRTWPNLVSMEAVRGAESYGFDSLYPQKAIWHNTILPFTRNSVGSMDYTPVTFSNHRFPHKTSFGNELALSIVFESGIVHFADKVESYKSLPVETMDFLKKLPAAWDSTLFLQGEPGKECIIARCADEIWYIGGINGSNEGKNWEIDLNRLPEMDYTVSIITDGAISTEFSSSITHLKRGDKLKVKVLPGGGFVATLKKSI